MHSFLPALDKDSQRVAALDEELDRECASLSARSRHNPRKPSGCVVRRAPRAAWVNSLSKNALSHAFIASRHRFPGTRMLPWHTRPPAIAVPIRCEHQRGVGSGPSVLGQSAHREFRSAYSEDQRRLGKHFPVQRSAVARIAEEHHAALLPGPPNHHVRRAREDVGRKNLALTRLPEPLRQLPQEVNGERLAGIKIRRPAIRRVFWSRGRSRMLPGHPNTPGWLWKDHNFDSSRNAMFSS